MGPTWSSSKETHVMIMLSTATNPNSIPVITQEKDSRVILIISKSKEEDFSFPTPSKHISNLVISNQEEEDFRKV